MEAPSDTLQVLMCKSMWGKSPATDAAFGTGDVTKALLADPLLSGPPSSCTQHCTLQHGITFGKAATVLMHDVQTCTSAGLPE